MYIMSGPLASQDLTATAASHHEDLRKGFPFYTVSSDGDGRWMASFEKNHQPVTMFS